ncbi:c-type cytochrome [Sphingosinithalassobacter sp. LHW66-3]|uniref:c-type cytochrome n=1 Tax=Sphingosinithalassobacter sp. LHW66-3 TaxID=3424718 RepID=UPI003D6B7AF2
MSATGKGVVYGAVGALVALILIGLFVVLTGSYNVAATERHTTVGEWALDTNFRNSVQGHGSDITAPELTPAMVAAGAGEYKAMCAHCHGGIGEGRAEWAQGMRPKPPALAGAADEWSASEVFWLVKHGARMTGMPAFGDTHDDRAIWNIAAFVKQMPEMSEDEYIAFGEGQH